LSSDVSYLLRCSFYQGVIASGLAALAVATGNHTLFHQAEITLDATIKRLTASNSVLKESCDDALANGTVCDIDQQTFKVLPIPFTLLTFC
jgi:hypothetical protein